MWAQAMVLQVVKLAISASKSPNPLSVEALFWPLTMASATLAGVLWPLRGWVSVYLCLVSLVVLWSTGSQSNHVFMDMVVCMAVLFTFSPDRRRWVGQATHAVRLFLVVLYLVTGLHKMNADWGRAEVSCCTLMLVGILALPPLRWALPMLPLSAAPHAATVVELGLPLLLLAGGPAASRVAAVLGCGFHLAICQMLSPMSVYPFSVLMAPLYVFVVPGQAAELFLAMRRWLPLLVPLFAVLCAVWTPLMAAGDLPDGEAPFEYPAYGSWAPGVVWCNFAYVGLIGAAVCRSSHGDSPAALPTRRGRLLAFVVSLFGLTPYLGLRNYPALAMFSNLRVEAGRSNHLFIGDDFDLTGWQRDYVTVHDTDIPALQLLQIDLGQRFTPATLRSLASVNVSAEFWITPPLSAWPYPPTRAFVPYSAPFLELRRRIAPLRAAGARGQVRYSRTRARPRYAFPALWRFLGRSAPSEDHVSPNLTYDLAVGDPEVEEPLPAWLATLARFRSFDLDSSPCRH